MNCLLLGLSEFKQAIKRGIYNIPLIEVKADNKSSVILKLSYRIPNAYLWEDGYHKDFWAFAFYEISIFINGDFIIKDPKFAPVSGRYKGLSKEFIGEAVSKLIVSAEEKHSKFKSELLTSVEAKNNKKLLIGRSN